MVRLVGFSLLVSASALLGEERDARYFRSEKAFLSGVEVSLKDLRFRSYIEAKYDSSGRIVRKGFFTRLNSLDRFEIFKYDSATGELALKSLYSADSTLRGYTQFGGGEEASEKFIRYTYGISRVRDHDDRYTSVENTASGNPQIYRFYDVNGYMYGAIELKYNDDGKVRQEDWIVMPSEQVVRRYVKSYDEKTGETDIWEYDSTLTIVNAMVIDADGRAPIISLLAPADNIPVNSSRISYHLKEDLVKGTLRWDWIGGKADSTAPHIVNLITSERTRGRHDDVEFRYAPQLNDSSLYRLTFSATGESGYPARNVILRTVPFDTTPPVYNVDAPAYSNRPAISYHLDEELSSAEVVWVWEQGGRDDASPHFIGLSRGMLEAGSQDSVMLGEDVQLADGTTYSVLFQGRDVAGNRGPFLSVSGVTYDTTRPEIMWQSPDSAAFVNSSVVSFILTEELGDGQIRWERTGGEEDDGTPHVIELTGTKLTGGEHLYEALLQSPELVNGASYTITMRGKDLAGNEAEPIVIQDILYDTSPPSLAAVAPEPGISVRDGEVIYTLDEDFASAEIDWILEGAEASDPRNVSITISDSALIAGDHRVDDSTYSDQLTDGGIFTIRLTGRDKAGNEATPSSIANVKFDITAPEFVEVTPGDCTFVMSPHVNYTLTEDLSDGTVIWTQVGGETDFSSPQMMQLPAEALTVGVHDSVLAVLSPTLQDGSIYVVSFMGIDAAGNRSLGASSKDVMYDITPPEIEFDFPITGSHVPDPSVSYSASERLQQGTVIWEWIEGILDVKAPHTVALEGIELAKGEHETLLLARSPKLVSGAVYSVTIEGRDLSGKGSEPKKAVRVTFDDTPPELAITSPAVDDYRNRPALGYELSEPLSSASIIWEWKDGAEDAESPHIVSLEPAELSGGSHPDFLTVNQPFLEDGGIYDLFIVGIDSAGNSSDTVSVAGIVYDITPPILEVSYPVSSTPTKNSEIAYTVSEQLKSGKLIWEWVNGEEDSLSSFVQTMSDSELVAGEHQRATLRGTPPALVEGAIYTVTVNGVDLAGNSSAPVVIADVRFDATAPVFADVKPDSGGFVNSTNLTYNLSESIVSGTVIWESQTPEMDEQSQQIVELTGEELSGGFHEEMAIANAPTLVDGAVYTIRLAGMDAAENLSDTVMISYVTYDAKPPVVELSQPIAQSFIKSSNLSYLLSETLSQGIARWERTGGSRDTAYVHEVQFVRDELAAGDHPDTKFFDEPSLAEGAEYRLTISGSDRAGNDSEPVVVENLIFDATAPLFDDVTPLIASHINEPLVGFWISENIDEGSLTWNHIGGESDESAPHISQFSGAELNAGTHAPAMLTETPSLVDGAIYSLSLLGRDPAGNLSDTLRIDSVHFDITAPMITVQGPDSGSFVNTPDVGYTLSETLAEGSITFRRSGGNADPRSPHTVSVSAAQLSQGHHDSLGKSLWPQLQDGTEYRITFEGADRAGNRAEVVSIEKITYDVTAPVIAGLSPVDSSEVNHARFSYTLSEAMVEGGIRWIWTGGAEDTTSSHYFEFLPEHLVIGSSNDISLEMPPALADGAVYTFEIFGSDAAGNRADTARVESILYDVTPPRFAVTFPSTDSYVLDSRIAYTISETLEQGTITWRQSSGAADTRSPHVLSLTEAERAPTGLDGALMTQPPLVDGAVYTVTFDGVDMAGNPAEGASIAEVKVDYSPPILTLSSPLAGAAIMNPDVIYNLSENLSDGTMIWTHIDGPSDPSSPHTVPLDSDELTMGDHLDGQLIFPPLLMDGAVYNLKFYGIDHAGNISDTVSVEGLRYDITPPVITVSNPVSDDYLNKILPSFSFTEDMLEASIVWARIEGATDPESPHTSALTGRELSEGDHPETALLNLPVLVDGTVYSVSFSGMDLAGNEAEPLLIDRVAYDVSVPVITVTGPEPNVYLDEPVVSFSLSEDLGDGELVWRDMRNSANSQRMKLPADLLAAGDHIQVSLDDSLTLRDGSVYSLLVTGVDRAGNEAEAVSVENIGFDTSPPTLTIVTPANGDYINSLALSFNLSEELKEGVVSWIRTGGTQDPIQKRTASLDEGARASGDHPAYTPLDMPPLVSGAFYSITIEGTDMAGNAGVPFTVDNLAFDNTPPVITASFPAASQFVNSKEVGYGLSEQFRVGAITWSRVGGSSDPFGPHEATLTETERTEGDHQAVTVAVPNLVDGAQYDIAFTGEDLAGNAAESVLVADVTYDVSSPQFKLDNPQAMSAVNSTQISYTLSETMAYATIEWRQAAGTADSASPHTIELTGDELSEGSKPDGVLSQSPALVDGAIYDITTSGSDRANNESAPATVNQVLFDVTPPAIVASAPTPTSFVRTTVLSYNLSETLSDGTVIWTRTGGEIDASSPHEVPLSGLELAMGEHNETVLVNAPTLVSGAVYSITFDGQDPAGNSASGMSIEAVTFDNVPPTLTLLTPTGSIAINEPKLTYSISETAVTGTVTFERTSGSEDPNSPHTVDLTEFELTSGEHPDALLVNSPTLVDGAIYRVTLRAVDDAGNEAEPAQLTGILYDSVLPVVTLNSPSSSAHIRTLDIDYTLSEAMAAATAKWTHTGGTADAQSPRVIELSVPEMGQGNRSGTLSGQIQLVDGAVYTLTLAGADAAGNEAVAISANNIKYDVTPPQFTGITPAEGFTNGRTFSYTLSETIVEGTIVFTRAGGVPDPSSPHTVPLSGSELTAGEHENIDLLAAPTLVSGASYMLAFSAVDSAGNASQPLQVGALMFDNTPPVVALTGPQQGSSVNHSRLSYELSETLASGTVTWMSSGGSPQIQTLLASELSAGLHSSQTLAQAPSLSDGTTYTLTFAGNDAAGNVMEEVTVSNVTFDTMPPKISIDFRKSAPSRGLFNYNSPVGMTFSEDMGEVTFRWEREGGSEDPGSPHTLFVAESDLGSGEHSAVQIPGAENVLIGTSYTLTIDGKDAAGNPAKAQTVENIEIVRPLDGEWAYQGIAVILWAFSEGSRFNQGVLFGNTLGDEKPGEYAIDWTKRPFRLAIKYDDGTRRYGLFEFIGHNRLRVVSSAEKRPSSWSDGDYFEFDYREKNIP